MEWFVSLFFKIGLKAFGENFFKPFLAHLDTTARLDVDKFKQATGADRDVAMAQTQAYVSAWHDRVDLLKGMKATQYLIIFALAPALIHQGMIYLDSSFCNDKLHQCMWLGQQLGMPWRVPPAPPPYDDREWQMIASLLGINTAMGLGIGAIRAWRSR